MVEDSQWEPVSPKCYHQNERVGKMTANLRYLWVGVFTIVSLISQSAANAQQIAWAKSLEEAQARAAAENKVVQLHFWATYCPPCRQLESFVFPVGEIADKMNRNVVPVKIDTQANPELAKKYAISKIPQDVFLGPNGEVLFRRISPTNSQNYGIMLDTAMKIARQTTRQSQMAMEAIASIGQKTENKTNQSMFLGQAAAAAGNARQQFAAGPQQGAPQHGVNAQLPAATVNYGNSAAPAGLAQSVDRLSENIQTRMPESQFPKAEFAAPKMPTLPNAFASNQQVNRSAPSQPTGRGEATILNPNVPAAITAQSTLPAPSNQIVSNRAAESPALPAPSLPKPSVAAQAPSATVAATNAAPQPKAEARFAVASSNPEVAQPIGTVATAANQASGMATQVTAIEAEPTGPELGLDGYCPVSLLKDQKWVKGNSDFGRIHRGKLYLFANEAAANQFFSTPDALSPALAGFDPVAFAATGKLIDGERKFGVFCETEGSMTIVLFANAANRDEFKANRQKYLQRIRVATENADRN